MKAILIFAMALALNVTAQAGTLSTSVSQIGKVTDAQISRAGNALYLTADSGTPTPVNCAIPYEQLRALNLDPAALASDLLKNDCVHIYCFETDAYDQAAAIQVLFQCPSK